MRDLAVGSQSPMSFRWTIPHPGRDIYNASTTPERND